MGFVLCRENKIQMGLLIILMLVSMALNLYVGGRIISLLPCIAFFFIFIAKRINYKIFLLVLVFGIAFYTFFGGIDRYGEPVCSRPEPSEKTIGRDRKVRCQ
jgi:hypothetical protein